ncbi:MAG: Fic/DOC family protein [Methanosaeta sp. PtaU1.Bin112]|nr:MAG: Fic/DOC family protein [Methanosaeta sp. PtaU1.Bin112]
MEKLTEEKVTQIHDFLIAEMGGNPGIRDRATLYFLVEAINHEKDLFRKAAYALFLADRHPFWDGQKRTAFALADFILRENSYRFNRDDRTEIMRVIIRIAEYRCPEGEVIDAIAEWIKKKALMLE